MTDKTKPTDKIVVNNDYGTTIIIKPASGGVDRLTWVSTGPNRELNYSGTIPAEKAWEPLEYIKERIGGGTPTHSADFHSVRWFGGQRYTFTHQQAAVVGLLWEAWENHTPDLSQEYLTEHSGSESSRLRSIFKERDGMHPAWGPMIVESRKGVYRLHEPGKES